MEGTSLADLDPAQLHQLQQIINQRDEAHRNGIAARQQQWETRAPALATIVLAPHCRASEFFGHGEKGKMEGKEGPKE